MRSGTPARGDLYMTAKGRTVEIQAVADIDCESLVESAEPIGSARVIAYRFIGAVTVHLVGFHDAAEWVRIEGV